MVDGYIALAAAICRSGRVSYDKSFLEGEWYKYLRGTVLMYIEEEQKKKGQSCIVVPSATPSS